MLQIQNIRKQYKTGGFVQQALDGVSLNLRKNEFVAILGPSGSGKTTLLNIIGGLDRYDSGDLIINGISTGRYKDKDWDSYRNHTIGFVFQSYNLIPHQTVLSNVELALTISGISRAERRSRAKKALEQVGLGEQLHKRPSQMSGGQMQRVAIARALVNDPYILLADEPTGALDSDTSVQVMDLLQEVAKDRLVVMVTHNPELAQAYATRIVTLRDGKIQSDSDPFELEDENPSAPVHKNMGKASMSFFTALSLSFHNLWTKKARTILTSFAGSIGIIGIALILSLSNGVNAYIKSVEEDTLSEYPLQIQSAGVDMTAMMPGGARGKASGGTEEVGVSQMITNMFSRVNSNDLGSLKKYLEDGESGVDRYANAVEYSYTAAPQIFRLEKDGVRQVNPDRSFSALGMGSGANTNSLMSMMMSTDIFHAMPENTSLFENQYEIKAGRWPQSCRECVLVLTSGGNISDFMLYSLGLRDSVELDEMIRQFLEEEEIDIPETERGYSYEDFLGITFKLVNAADYYEYDDEYGVWKDRSDDGDYLRNLVEKGEDISIVGVVQPMENASAAMLTAGIGYPASLTRHVMEQAAASPIVRQQLGNQAVNVLTGNSFGEDNSKNKLQMDSLFTVDEKAMQEAFQFDESSLDAGSFDLSGIDLSGISLPAPNLPGPDLESVLGRLDLDLSAESLRKIAGGLLEGYGDYAAKNPEADYSRLNEYFLEYLETPEAKQLLAAGIRDMIASGNNLTVSTENLELFLRDILEGFGAYAAANGMTDPSQIGDYLDQYLQTPEAQQKIADGAASILQVRDDIDVLPEQLNALAESLAAGYQAYAAANSLPDPSKMGQHFMAYLQTPEAQKLLSDGVAELLDAGDFSAQLSSALGSSLQSSMDAYTGAISQALQNQLSSAMGQMMSQMGQAMENALHIDTDAFAKAIKMKMDENELSQLLRSLMSAEDASYGNNLKNFGYADPAEPSEIDVYPRDFESKASILELLDDYNSRMEAEGQEEKVISYTDLVGTLMSSVTEIVDIISYVLVAFVAISLIVSSIMIGVITYISVLERSKEIGILRAIGASKRNISQVFNAETFIIGLCAGVIGIGLTLLLLLPGNALIHSLAGTTDINASLPVLHGAVLVVLSVLLTLLGGLIPSRKAAKSDPVTALRSE